MSNQHEWEKARAATIRSKCAWCNAIIDGMGPIFLDQVVSHGICEPCAARYFPAAVYGPTNDTAASEAQLLARQSHDRARADHFEGVAS